MVLFFLCKLSHLTVLDYFEDNHKAIETSPKSFDIRGIKQQQAPCKITQISLNAQVLIPLDEQTPTGSPSKKLEVGYNHFKKAIATFWTQSNISTSSSTVQSRCHSAASKRVTTTQITESSSPNPYSRNEPFKKPYQIFSQKQPLSMAKINIESKTMHDSNVVEKSTNVSTNISRCEKVMFISMDHGHSTNFDSLKTGVEKSRKEKQTKAFSKLIKSKETAGTPRLDIPEAKPSPYFARVMSATTSNVFKVKKSTNNTLYDTKSLKHHSASQKKLSTFVNPAENEEKQSPIQETFANYIKNKLQRSSIISDSQGNSLTNTQVETTINQPKSKKVSILLPQPPEEEEEIQPPKEEQKPASHTLPIMSQIRPYDQNKSASPNIETILTSPKNVGKKPTTLQRPFTSKPATTTALFHEKKPKHANERVPYQSGFTRSSTNQHIDVLNDSDSFEIEGWVQDNDPAEF